MSKSPPRPHVLRHYYEDTWHGRGYTVDTFVDATFDEFFWIRKLCFPGTTLRRAAANSYIPRFQALVDELPPDPPKASPQLRRHAHVARSKCSVYGAAPGIPTVTSLPPQVDLQQLALPIDIELLIVDRVKESTGWEALRGLTELRDVACVLLGSTPDVWLGDTVSVTELSLTDCGPSIEDLLLAACSAQTLAFSSGRRWLDLSALRKHQDLRELHFSSPLIRGVACLRGLKLQRLSLGAVEPDDELFGTLAQLSERLEVVRLGSTATFSPTKLPTLPKLRQLSVTGYPEHQAEWIEYAVSHPHAHFEFPAPASDEPSASVQEIYRGVDILRLQKRRKVEFTIEADVASLREGYDGSNGDLEDELRPLARQAKMKVRWGSEADTLVASASDVATCRWVIDQALGRQTHSG